MVSVGRKKRSRHQLGPGTGTVFRLGFASSCKNPTPLCTQQYHFSAIQKRINSTASSATTDVLNGSYTIM